MARTHIDGSHCKEITTCFPKQWRTNEGSSIFLLKDKHVRIQIRNQWLGTLDPTDSRIPDSRPPECTYPDFRFHISDFGFQTRTGGRKTVRCPRINSDSRPSKNPWLVARMHPKHRTDSVPVLWGDRLWSVPAFFQLSIPKILFRVLCCQGVIF